MKKLIGLIAVLLIVSVPALAEQRGGEQRGASRGRQRSNAGDPAGERVGGAEHSR